MDGTTYIKLQAHALIVYKYNLRFSQLEKIVKNIFYNSFSKMDGSSKNNIYFFVGGKFINNVDIDYTRASLKLARESASKDKMIKELTFNNIMKIQKAENLINYFNFTIASILTKLNQLEFTDCCIKLINMRNILAHEIDGVTFKDKDVIEKLNIDKIRNQEIDWLKDINLSVLEDIDISIISNYIFIVKILVELEKISNKSDNSDEKVG